MITPEYQSTLLDAKNQTGWREKKSRDTVYPAEKGQGYILVSLNSASF
jgi:hypothetical protein